MNRKYLISYYKWYIKKSTRHFFELFKKTFLVISDSHTASLCMYLLGKFGATAAFTIVYVITSELFPTNLRQSFMGTCSTFGRLGSMIAPQMPLLVSIYF